MRLRLQIDFQNLITLKNINMDSSLCLVAWGLTFGGMSLTLLNFLFIKNPRVYLVSISIHIIALWLFTIDLII
jgi:hypothetical protein